MTGKICSQCKEIRPLSDFGRRAASVDGLQFRCRTCKAETSLEERRIHGARWNASERERYWENQEARAAKMVRYRERMKDPGVYAKKRAKVVEWLQANPGKTSEYAKRNHDKNRESRRESAKVSYWRDPDKERLRMMKYQKNNKHVYAANEAARRALKLEATPMWLDDKQRDLMKCFYIVSGIMTDLTGERHHVDHIHPLKGVSSRGLHVPWNLRVITASANIAKSNNMLEA